MAETMANRIKKRRLELGLSQTQLAEKSGVSQQMISKLETGKTEDTSAIVPLAKALETSAEELEDGAPAPTAKPRQRSDTVEVRLYNALGSMGKGAINEDAVQIGTLTFKRRSFSKKGITSPEAFYVTGDSMLPRPRPGDTVVFDTADRTARSGKMYVITFNGEEFVKRLRQYDGRWWIASDNNKNSENPDIPISERDQFNVVGRVRWIGSWED